MNDIFATLKRWQLDDKTARERMYRAPTPRECEHCHAIWLLTCDWTTSQATEAWSAMRIPPATG